MSSPSPAAVARGRGPPERVGVSSFLSVFFFFMSGYLRSRPVSCVS